MGWRCGWKMKPGPTRPFSIRGRVGNPKGARPTAPRVCPGRDGQVADPLSPRQWAGAGSRCDELYPCRAAPLDAADLDGGVEDAAGGNTVATGRPPGRLGTLAGGVQREVHVAGDLAATPPATGFGQPHRAQDARTGVLVDAAGHHAAVHPCGRELVEHGRVDPAHSGSSRPRRSLPDQRHPSDRVVGSQRPWVEPPPHTLRLGRKTTRPPTAVSCTTTSFGRFWRLYPSAHLLKPYGYPN